MSHSIARGLLVLSVALALGACIASTNPVGPESAAVAEPGLVGSWRYTGTVDVWNFVHVLPLPGNRVQVVAINDRRSDWAVLVGHVSAAGPRRVLNVRLVSASDDVREQVESEGRPDHPYSFIVYRLEGKDRLVTAQPFGAIQKALQNGKLTGESADDDVFVADEPERIAAVFASASDPDLFAETVVYLRVAAP